MTTYTTSINRSVAHSAPERHSFSLSATPRLIVAGVIAGPLLVAISFVQIPFQPGFDVTRHAFSFLLLGVTGWVEQLAFITAGVLFVAGAVGAYRILGGRADATKISAELRQRTGRQR